MALGIKNPPANAGDSRDMGSIPGLEASLEEENGNPLQYSCLKNSMHTRRLVDYRPRGRKELDTTEHTKHVGCTVSLKGCVEVLNLSTFDNGLIWTRVSAVGIKLL